MENMAEQSGLEDMKRTAFPAELCEWERIPDPGILIIFGASGDLTARKLIPALYRLFLSGELPARFCILGTARTAMNETAFRSKMKQALTEAEVNLDRWDEFERLLHYLPMAYDNRDSYLELHSSLSELEKVHHTENRIFYMAIPPSLYGEVVRELGHAGLTQEDEDPGHWNRLVVEKPFGYDLASAKKLNASIARSFKEHQVFRIDHYMTKQTVRNIMILRFANAIFEPLWNRNFIEYVRISASEALGVEHRAGYYDKSGVLRDMFQNHMLELLALVAGEPPSTFAANRVRAKKGEIFRCLRPFEPAQIDETLSLGQYAEGETGGQSVAGYREEPDVALDSLTPTYALLKVFVDNWRWQGVPFYITSGKRLKRKVTRIDIQFKGVPHSMFRDVLEGEISANRLVIGIYPEETIFLNFQAIKPGTRFCLRTAGLNFSFSRGQKGARPDAYQKALLDVMVGDQTLFWDQEGLELAWEFMDPIIAASESRKDRAKFIHSYTAGSLGPDEAIDMLPTGSWPEKP